MLLRAVIFDFDGVIANSEPLHLRAYQEVLAREGLALTSADYYSRYLGFDDAEVFRRVGEEGGTAWTARQIAALIDRKARRLEVLERDVPILFPGADAAIRRTAAAVPIAIASGALGAEIRRVLDHAALTPYFTAIVSAEDTPRSKPAPDPYAEAVARLGTATGEVVPADRCVAVEDSRWGLQSARAAGLRTIGITHTYPAAELASADATIGSLDDLTIDGLSALLV